MNTSTQTEKKRALIRHRAEKSFNLHNRIADAATSLKSPIELRDRIAHESFLVTIEHHAAISILMKIDHYASSFALHRPLIESTMRGLWALHVATDENLLKFSSKKAKNDLESLARYLEKAPSRPELKILANAVKSFGKIVNSFSHAGLDQLVRRESGFFESELMESLVLVDLFAALAGDGLAKIHNNMDLRTIMEITAPELAAESQSLQKASQ